MSIKTILDLSHYGFLHYLESRDDGMYHVFKSLTEQQAILDQIVSDTQFIHDKTALGMDWSVSLSCKLINYVDIAALKNIFPRAEFVKVHRDSVVFDRKTQQFDMVSYQFKNHANMIKRPLDGYGGLGSRLENYLGVTSLNEEQKALIEDLNNRVLKGEFSRDTFPLWRLFFLDEKRYLATLSDLQNSPILKTCFDWIKSDLLITRHPGFYFGKPSEDIPRKHVKIDSEIVKRISLSENGPELGVIDLTKVVELERSEGVSEIAFLDKLKPGEITALSEAIFSGAGIDMKSPQFIENSNALIVAKFYEFNRLLSLTQNTISLNEKTQVTRAVIEKRNDILDYMAQVKRGIISPQRKDYLSVIGLINFVTSSYHSIVPDSLKMALQDTDKLVTTGKALIDTQFLTKLKELSGTYSEENKIALQDTLTDINDLIYANTLSRNLGFDSIIKGNSFDLIGTHFSNEKLSDEVSVALSKVLALYKVQHEIKEEARIEEEREAARKTLHSMPIASVHEQTSQLDLLGNSFNTFVHTDVGEKFGGARKDKYTRINSTNVLELSFEEKISFTKKDKIWPKPDWEQLINEGMALEVAAVIKKMRNTISPTAEKVSDGYYRNNKYVSPASTDNEIILWVKATEKVRDKVMACKRVSDLQATLDTLKKDLSDYDCLGEQTLFNALGNNWKKFYFRNGGYARELNNILHYKIYYGKEKYETHIKTKLLGIKPNKQDTDQTQGQSIEAVIEKKKLLNPLPVHLKHITRTGPDWRKGVDVTGEQLMETFGFKGIEYGNWVANKERQVILNHAYDAFMDLSIVIGLGSDHLKMIGFNGYLGISFGSRGIGKAMAHYEPLRNVINLTKIKGAGSLAHEWMHALDDHIGQLTGTRLPREKLFSTSQLNKLTLKGANVDEILNNIDSDLKERFKVSSPAMEPTLLKLATAVLKMTAVTRTKDEADEDRQRQITACIDNMVSHLGGWSKYIGNEVLRRYQSDLSITLISTINKDLMRSEYQKYRESSKLDKDASRFFTTVITAAMIAANPILASKHDELKAQVDQDCKRYSRGQLTHHYLVSAYDGPIDRTLKRTSGLVMTQFFEDAKILDGKGKSYWTEPHEMLARAFAVAVNDHLADRDIQSDYLVRGSSRNEFADRSVYKANANPENEERAAMSHQFDEVFKCFYEFSVNQIEKECQEEELGLSMPMG